MNNREYMTHRPSGDIYVMEFAGDSDEPIAMLGPCYRGDLATVKMDDWNLEQDDLEWAAGEAWDGIDRRGCRVERRTTMKVEMDTTEMTLIASLLHNETANLAGRPSTDHIARKYEKARQNILAQLEDMGLVFPCYCDHCAESLDY